MTEKVSLVHQLEEQHKAEKESLETKLSEAEAAKQSLQHEKELAQSQVLQGAGEKEEQIKNLQKQLEEVKESTKKEVDETMNQMIVVSDEAEGLRAKVELYESQIKEL